MSHKIVNVSNEPLKGCCTFEYKGYIVSLSTVFPDKDIAVFKVDDSTFEAYGFDSVEHALNYIGEKVNV